MAPAKRSSKKAGSQTEEVSKENKKAVKSTIPADKTKPPASKSRSMKKATVGSVENAAHGTRAKPSSADTTTENSKEIKGSKTGDTNGSVGNAAREEGIKPSTVCATTGKPKETKAPIRSSAMITATMERNAEVNKEVKLLAKSGSYYTKLWMDWSCIDFIQWVLGFHYYPNDIRLLWESGINGTNMEPLIQYCMDYDRKDTMRWEIDLPECPVAGLSSVVKTLINKKFWTMAVADLKNQNTRRN